MANILQSLGDAMERQQQRKHENNMEVLRAINTRPGMVVLGVILLGAALALIWPQIAPEADNTNSIVIDMSDFDSVSYTHLDVYKRQVWVRCTWLRHESSASRDQSQPRLTTVRRE